MIGALMYGIWKCIDLMHLLIHEIKTQNFHILLWYILSRHNRMKDKSFANFIYHNKLCITVVVLGLFSSSVKNHLMWANMSSRERISSDCVMVMKCCCSQYSLKKRCHVKALLLTVWDLCLSLGLSQ